jgi:uncharacterized protein
MYNRPGKGRGRVCRKALQYIRSALDRQATAQKDPLQPSSASATTASTAPSLQASAASSPVIVLDTNAVLDWLVFEEAAFAELSRAMAAAEVRCVTCPAMRSELAHVLGRAALARYQPDGERTLSLYDQWTVVCADPLPTHAPILRCRDEDDQVFLDLALREGAGWLLTRDRDLLCLTRKARKLGLTIAVPEVWAQARKPGTG